MLHENVRIPLQFALNNVYKILRLQNILQDDSCTSEILIKLAQLLIAVLNYIVSSIRDVPLTPYFTLRTVTLRKIPITYYGGFKMISTSGINTM